MLHSWMMHWVSFRHLRKPVLRPLCCLLPISIKHFFLETDASNLGLGIVPSQKQTDGWYHPVAFASHSLTVHECNYLSTKQEFLALKWAIAEQFEEYLLWKRLGVKTDNNLLTYIMTTPNLDATQHHWEESLAGFTLSIEYQKEWDNAATDALSQVTSRLDVETVKSILNGVTVGLTGRTDAYDPVVAETAEEIPKQVWTADVQARATHTHVNLHVTDWVAYHWEDPILKTMIDWVSNQKVQNLKHPLGDDAHIEEGMA